MKNYFVECSIKYTDNTDDGIYVGVEAYRFTILANSSKIAEEKARLQALKDFNENINDGFQDDVDFSIFQCYETSDDARSD